MRNCRQCSAPLPSSGFVCDSCKLARQRANYLRKDAKRQAARPAGRRASVTLGRRGTVAEYFAVKVRVDDSCHTWVGALNNNGYGVFPSGRRADRTRSAMAHRWIYEEQVGRIPDGLELDHLCRNRACVNVAHLEPVTSRENTLRAMARAA